MAEAWGLYRVLRIVTSVTRVWVHSYDRRKVKWPVALRWLFLDVRGLLSCLLFSCAFYEALPFRGRQWLE